MKLTRMVVVLTALALCPATALAEGCLHVGLFAMDMECSDYAAPYLFLADGNWWVYVEDEHNYTGYDIGFGLNKKITLLTRIEDMGSTTQVRPGISYRHESGFKARIFAGTDGGLWMLDIYPPATPLMNNVTLSGDPRLYEGGEWEGWIGPCVQIGKLQLIFHNNLRKRHSDWQVITNLPVADW